MEDFRVVFVSVWNRLIGGDRECSRCQVFVCVENGCGVALFYPGMFFALSLLNIVCYRYFLRTNIL